MKRLTLLQSQAGATLVEVLVATALAGIMLPTLAIALVTANHARPTASQQLIAAGDLHELTEAVRSVRESGWANVTTNGTYHPIVSGNGWALSAGPETVSGFTKQIVISGVERDSSGVIVSSGGTDDPSTKRVTATVSWSKPVSSSISSEAYLSRWQNNAAWTQTTQSDFDAGTYDNTASTSTGGGEVDLAGGGHGISWATPTQAGSLDISGTTNANGVYTDASTNRAYLVNGDGLSIIDVSDPTNPTLMGSFSAGLAIEGVYVAGNYAYLASSSNTAELTVVDVSNPASPALAGSLNLGNNANANSIFVAGSYAYIGKALNTTSNGDEFYVVNVSNPASPTLSGSINLNGTISSVYVSGNYAYLASSDTTAELTIIDISNKSTPTIAGTYATTGAVAANSVFYDGTYVYLGEANNAGGPEFFVLDASNPSAVSTVGSYEVGGSVNGVYVVGAEAFLGTSAAGHQFSVLDLSTISSPTLEGNDNPPAPNAVFVANDTAYLATSSNTAEFVVMQGSATTGGKAASGTYESPTFDAGANADFNYLTFTTSQPTGSSITFQFASNNDNSTWNYVGPDGTIFSQYTTPGAIPFLNAGDRYFRYKATLTTTNVNTHNPAIDDVTLNYSP
jgi:hypothetical protein